MCRLPDMHPVPEVGTQLFQVDGSVYVFTLDADPDVTAHARMFAPQLGIPEDPVTGNGNGPLGAYLVHHRLVPAAAHTVYLRARQREAMGRPGTAHVWVDVESGEPQTVRVGGDAVIAGMVTRAIRWRDETEQWSVRGG